MNTADHEFSAIQAVFTALEPLDSEARQRVINYIRSRLEIGSPLATANPAGPETEETARTAGTAASQADLQRFGTFAELFDAAQPSTNGDKALVAGYWVQICQGSESFDSQSANTALKHLGHGLANVTAAIDSLKAQKPALVLQLKKSGSSQQARKTYMVTAAGIKFVENMIRG